jgi:hypothetical protein
MILVEPAEFREARQVANERLIHMIVTSGHHPAHVRPEEPIANGGVHIAGFVGVAMVHAMMRRPPDDALLRGGLGQKSHAKLRNPSELEALVAEVAVVAGRHAEHANEVASDRPSGKRPSEIHEKDSQASQMQHHKRNAGRREKDSHRRSGTYYCLQIPDAT